MTHHTAAGEVIAPPTNGGYETTVLRTGTRGGACPMVVPGVAWTSKPTLEVRAPGDLAFACWGSTVATGTGDGWLVKDGRPYDGYVTVCHNFGAESPQYWTAQVTDGATLLPEGESAWTSGEYLGAPATAADGSIWAGFLSRGNGGVVARLVPH